MLLYNKTEERNNHIQPLVFLMALVSLFCRDLQNPDPVRENIVQDYNGPPLGDSDFPRRSAPEPCLSFFVILLLGEVPTTTISPSSSKPAVALATSAAKIPGAPGPETITRGSTSGGAGATTSCCAGVAGGRGGSLGSGTLVKCPAGMRDAGGGNRGGW